MSCSSGCKFCFENYLTKVFPDIVIKNEGPRYWFRDGKVHHCRYSDFFDKKIDIRKVDLFKHVAYGYLYTTGLNLSVDDAKYFSDLSVKPGFCFSVITLDEDLRKELFTKCKEVDEVLKLIEILREPHINLFCLSYDQILKDIAIINSVSKKCTIGIALLEYNKYYPEYLIEYSKQGRKDFQRVVKFLYENKIENYIKFFAPSEIYAWNYREEIRQLLDQYEITNNDLILCSGGAFNTIRKLFKNVKCIPNDFGGSIDFATAITSENVEECLEENWDRVFVPSNIWWINNRYDFKGNSFNDFKRKHPNVEIVSIPEVMMGSSLKLEDCYTWSMV